MRHFFHPAPPTAIGDVQGCYAELQGLLAQATPPFWFCGDLVNRGPDSLACLRTVKHLCERHGVLRRQLNTTCLGSLYIQDFDGAMTLCEMRIVEHTETVLQNSTYRIRHLI